MRAIAVAGQQHGMVALDEDRRVVRKALLWNDTRSAGAAADLVRELGGPQAWADAVGTVPLASITVAKLRWFAEHEPDLAERTHDVVLPHDWLTAQIVGSGSASGVRLVTDRGDASGTGYWAPSSGDYRTDLLIRAFGRDVGRPEVLGPYEPAGATASGMVVGPGHRRQHGAALGLGLGPGDIVVSLGTSGTVFGVAEAPTADPTGFVAGFADATGRFLPLVCTLNAARVLTSAATMLGTDHAGLDELALSARPGAGGLTLLPYLDGERTPDLPDATGTLGGITRGNLTPANVARAAVEGMLCGLADGLDALRDNDVPVQRVLLIGGAARSTAVQAVASGIFGVPVSVPSPGGPRPPRVRGARRRPAGRVGARAQPRRRRRGGSGLDGGRPGGARRRRRLGRGGARRVHPPPRADARHLSPRGRHSPRACRASRGAGLGHAGAAARMDGGHEL